MGTRSKFFRAFVEGNTIYDGRVITAEMIDQVVETHNLDSYTPRCNVEHVSGYSPEPPFNGYGNVAEAKAQDDTITIAGKPEKRRALYLSVDANDQLVKLSANNQKPFPSVELTDNYAGTGKFGLVGLAFTDRPASIATQALQFSSHAPGTVHAFTPDATPLEFEPAPVGIADMVKSAVASAMAKFTSGQPEKPKDEPKPKAANDNNFDPAAFASALGESLATTMAAAVKPATDAVTALQARFSTMEIKLASTEQPALQRGLVSGGGDEAVTDC